MSQRVALVTGGARGIGAAISSCLAAHGMRVAVGYFSNQLLAEALAAQISSQGAEAMALRIDVSDRNSIRAAMAQIAEKLGPVDVLINNAATAQEKPFLNITDEDWNQMLGANLRGPFACTQEVLPGMIERGWGRVVNIVSIGGQWGGVNQIHYASAKAGLIGLTRSLAKTFSSRGVTVNAVSPGLVKTDMTRSELASVEGQKKVVSIPVGRVGHANEIAYAVAYLVLPGSDYVTGQTINVNGGMYFG
jgi:NAD(P)-dependent dehydrogenase (short-subunit alcohol dehydrogenase family)